MATLYVITREQFDLSAKIAELRREAQDALRTCNGTLAQKLAIKRTVTTLGAAHRQILEVKP